MYVCVYMCVCMWYLLITLFHGIYKLNFVYLYLVSVYKTTLLWRTIIILRDTREFKIQDLFLCSNIFKRLTRLSFCTFISAETKVNRVLMKVNTDVDLIDLSGSINRSRRGSAWRRKMEVREQRRLSLSLISHQTISQSCLRREF